jgi:SPP1 family predicted phage head-tail adaptor
MDPGSLRIEMILQEAIEIPDGSGGFMVLWNDIAVVWTAIEAVSPRTEGFGARQQDEASHSVTMRYRPDVKAGQRLKRGNRNYRINLVSERDGTERYLTCFVLEERP